MRISIDSAGNDQNNQIRGNPNGNHRACFRCGRTNHLQANCRARFHIDGRALQ